QALHALQDFFAHSNFVNLNSNPTSNPLSPEQQKLIDYLLSESPPGDFSDLPNGLLITAFGHVDPEDIYPHNATEISPLGEAKDNPNHHDHDLAATFAASASVTFLNQHVSLFHDMDDKCAAAWKDSSEIGSVGGLDPNDKAGLQGSGQALYLSGAGTLRYAIFFENLPTATAAAQEVVITDQLDPTKVDASTFNLGLITFGERSVNPPPGLNRYTADVDLRPANNLIVRINAGLAPTTGIAIWRF